MVLVRVWRFSLYNIANGENDVSNLYGTREAIAAAGGILMEGSDIGVDETKLDEKGMITIDSPPGTRKMAN